MLILKHKSLMTFLELLKDIFESYKQRTKSPITGAFVISFIIWNWRPIIFLFFERASVSDKIVIINAEYCSYWAILGPLVVTLVYVLIVPFLSMNLDRLLLVTKKANLKSIYQEKIYDTLEKIELAKQEIRLQDVISRKLEVEELLEQINNLKSKIKEDEITNKAIINDYKTQIQELTNHLNQQNDNKNKTRSNTFFDKELLKFYTYQLSVNEKNQIKSIPVTIDEPIKVKLNGSVLDFLIKNECVILNENKMYLSKKGIEFLVVIKDSL